LVLSYMFELNKWRMYGKTLWWMLLKLVDVFIFKF